MTDFSVTLFDHTPMPQADIDAACDTYKQALLRFADADLLRAMHADDQAGQHAGVEHFEVSGQSAWSGLDIVATTAAYGTIGYVPGEAAHFQVAFSN